MKQEEARRRAKELGGIAVSAHPRVDANGVAYSWRLGGALNRKGETWIVISANKKGAKVVLDDSRTPGDELGDERTDNG